MKKGILWLFSDAFFAPVPLTSPTCNNQHSGVVANRSTEKANTRGSGNERSPRRIQFAFFSRFAYGALLGLITTFVSAKLPGWANRRADAIFFICFHFLNFPAWSSNDCFGIPTWNFCFSRFIFRSELNGHLCLPSVKCSEEIPISSPKIYLYKTSLYPVFSPVTVLTTFFASFFPPHCQVF